MIHRLIILAVFTMLQISASSCKRELIISSNSDNDLYVVMQNSGIKCIRYDSPMDAVENAPAGTGVMILADGYPFSKTELNEQLYARAAEKNLKLYVEFPSHIPGSETGEPKGTHWERAVISSEAFDHELQKLRILAIHDCKYVPVDMVDPDIVVARVAGFDSAVYGLPSETYPVLAKINDGLMVSSTKLSQFITARYAPQDAWQAVWKHILEWLGHDGENLVWSPAVNPSYSLNDPLSVTAEKDALERGTEWFFKSRMLLHPAMMEKYNKPANLPNPAAANPDTTQDWPYGHRTAKMVRNAPVGNGKLGVMEGFDAKIFYDGTQPVRWWNRGDCNGEIAGSMSLAGLVLDNNDFLSTGGNIGDWLFFESMMSNGDRATPSHAAYGLLGWNDTPEYCGEGTMDGFGVYYGDDNARILLGMMLAAAAQETERYDWRIMNGLLGNLRISSRNGFQPDRIDHGPLEKSGWRKLFTGNWISFSPHYQANMWACYLWAYGQTGFSLFLRRAETAIRMTMDAYPGKWIWTNGIQQERAKMLLPLAWLVRVDDTPEHREWLRKIAGDLLAGQVECGAIREEIGEAGKGGCPPPASNEAYGTAETPLIQTNDDEVCDLLYTTNFAFLGLHEAAAATGDKYYKDAENRLAGFLCRIQIRSEKRPELDGGWFRAFDFNRWEYWASNADAGWGAWSIESGWTQSWITSVLALRQMSTSFWEYTGGSNVETHFEKLRQQMIPDLMLKKIE